MDFVACQAPLSMGFSRQEYWSGLPCPPPGDLPDPGIDPGPPSSQAERMGLGEPAVSAIASLIIMKQKVFLQKKKKSVLFILYTFRSKSKMPGRVPLLLTGRGVVAAPGARGV